MTFNINKLTYYNNTSYHNEHKKNTLNYKINNGTLLLMLFKYKILIHTLIKIKYYYIHLILLLNYLTINNIRNNLKIIKLLCICGS